MDFERFCRGVESWYDLGGKSKTGRQKGEDKVKQVANHINMILDYIPYVQVNFVLGMDCDQGTEPFELTKQFLDLAPGAFPAFSLLTAYGQSAPYNLTLQQDGRVIPFPFHFLDNNHSMNVRPKHYAWPEFYDHVIDISEHAFSWPMIAKRFMRNRGMIPKWYNLVRSVSTGGFGRIDYHKNIRKRLDTRHSSIRSFMDGDTTELPPYYYRKIKKKLGSLWEMLPPDSVMHDHHAYLHSQSLTPITPLTKDPPPALAETSA